MPIEQMVLTAAIGAASGFVGNFILEIIKRAWNRSDALKAKIEENAKTIGELQQALLRSELEVTALSGYADMRTSLTAARRLKARERDVA